MNSLEWFEMEGITHPHRLGQMLIDLRLLTPSQLEDALRIQLIEGGRLGSILIEMGLADEQLISSLLAEQLHTPALRLVDALEIPREILRLIPAALAERFIALPFGLTPQGALVACADPEDLEMVDALRFAVGKRLLLHVAPEGILWRLLARHYQVAPPDRALDLHSPEHDTPVDQAAVSAASLPTQWHEFEASALQGEREAPAPTPPSTQEPWATALRLRAAAVGAFGRGLTLCLTEGGYQAAGAFGPPEFKAAASRLTLRLAPQKVTHALGGRRSMLGGLPLSMGGRALTLKLGLNPDQPLLMVARPRDGQEAAWVFLGGEFLDGFSQRLVQVLEGGRPDA